VSEESSQLATGDEGVGNISSHRPVAASDLKSVEYQDFSVNWYQISKS